MFSPNTAEDKVRQFVESLPPGFKTLNQEMKNQLKQALLQWFNSMDLVTREEFDIQCQVLIKTRLKLDELSTQLDALSAKNEDN